MISPSGIASALRHSAVAARTSTHRHVCRRCEVSWCDPAGLSACWNCGTPAPLTTATAWMATYVGISYCPATVSAAELPEGAL